ncbi:MAG: hypothetical protein RL291_1206, partial [Pseudomonadota bacterium]
QRAAPGAQPQGPVQRISQRINRALRPSSGEHSGLGLSSKLLILTTIFVMIAEVMIFLPSVAKFRENWLSDRVTAAQIAALAADANPAGTVPEMLQVELLKTAQVLSVALKRNDQRRLVLANPGGGMVDATVDLREPDPPPNIIMRAWSGLMSIRDAIAVFFMPQDRLLLVIGQPNMGVGEYIEVMLPEAPLRKAMVRYGLNVLWLSIIISAMTAALVYLALNALLVRPMTRITRNMLRFSERPEDQSRIIKPSDRGDEIGTAERELSHMQTELSQLLAQKTRLAALGLAVSKINHDLRNMLSTAQLISDRLTTTTDPTVQRFAPKLIVSLDRAINFCNDTLKFGRAAEAPPRRAVFELRPLVIEVAEGLSLPREAVHFVNAVPETLKVDADRDHLYRVLSNLARNAAQAIEALEDAKRPLGDISIIARREDARVVIDVVDTGPGLPQKAKAHLFEAFQGSARKGGTGLGLAIARELIQAHGGSLTYADPEMLPEGAPARGTRFVVVLPDRDHEN